MHTHMIKVLYFHKIDLKTKKIRREEKKKREKERGRKKEPKAAKLV